MADPQNQEAPVTLPADFFTKKKTAAPVVAPTPKPAPTGGATPTLPADFFSSKKAKPPAQQPTPQPVQQAVPPPQPKPQEQEPWYQRAPRAALKAAGLPETLGDVPQWAGWFIHGDVFAPVKEAMKNPSQESIVNAIPVIGPASVQAAEHARKGDWPAMVGSLTGSVAPFAASKVSVVHGDLKASIAAAKAAKVDVAEATSTAHKISKYPVINAMFNQKAIEDAYVDLNGVDVAKKIVKAADEASVEAKSHATYLSSAIDTAIPSGVVDAGAQAQSILQEFADVVKTPEKAHPALAQMVKDAQATAPGQWSFEKTRQFRSSVGRALRAVKGPQYAVMAKTYGELSDKLSDVASKYGLKDSWTHYNELEEKLHNTFGDIIDSARSAQRGRGAEMASILNKDVSYTGRFLKSIEKYGVNSQEVLDYLKQTSKINKLRGKSMGTIFRWAYGNPYGAAATIGAKMAGVPYAGAMGAGAAVGITATYLTRLSRALRLSPQVLDYMLKEEEWPGKQKFPRGNFPEGEEGLTTLQGGNPPATGGAPHTSQGGAPQMGQGAPPQLPGPGMPLPQGPPMGRPTPQLPAPSPFTPDVPGGESEVDRLLRNPPRPTQEMTPEQQKAAEVKPKPKTASEKARLTSASGPPVTKVAPGEVGREPGARPGTTRESKIGRNTKQAERVAAKRGQAMRSKQADEAEAAARAQAKDVSVAHIQIPEAEEALQGLNPKGFAALQKFRKIKKLSDAEYLPALHEMLIRAYEQGSTGK